MLRMHKSTATLALLIALSINTALAQNATERSVVYAVPGMEEVRVRRDLPYKTSGDTLTFAFDLYLPSREHSEGPAPVVVFVNAGGLQVRDWEAYRSWGRLVAASGLAGVTYDALDPSNTADLRDVVRHLRAHADELGTDGNRIAIWASSRNVAVALPYLADPTRDYLRAAVLYYGVTGPAVPLRRDLPVLITRAGRDAPFINRGLDAQVTQALRDDVDLTLFNYQNGRHAFDVLDDTDTSRRIIAATLDFLQARLGSDPLPPPAGPSPTRIYYLFEQGDADEALAALRRTYATPGYDVGAATHALNTLGYLLLGEDRVDDAVAVFRLNVELHPGYANGWDSLGEGLATSGAIDEAVAAYERALALDPDGSVGANARQQLERLRTEDAN